MDIFSNDRTVPLDDVPHVPLFEGKNRAIIGGSSCAET
jgi:hypothetical protein